MASEIVNYGDVLVAVEPYVGKLAGMRSADEIYEFLAGEGVKADVGQASSCAIAEYVYQKTGVEVAVDYDGVYIPVPNKSDFTGKGVKALYYKSRDNVTEIRPVAAVAELTLPMATFVRFFDNGEYPELVSGERP